MRRALYILLAAWAAAVNAAPTNASQEQADLRAAELVETAVEAQIQGGGDPRTAMERLDRMFSGLETKYPHSAMVRDAYGDFLWAAERKEEAFKKWQEAEKLDGNDADVCLHLGACWLEHGNTQRATAYFEKASALAPQDALLHFHLGNDLYLFRRVLATAGDSETAIADRALGELKRAADLEPMNAEYAKGYAETFYSLPAARWGDALKAWQHLYDISENKDVALINLARVSLLINDKVEARRYLEKVKGSQFEGLRRKMMAKAGINDQMP